MNTALEHSSAAARLSAEIEAYWDERSEAFSKVRLQELNGPDGRAWWETIAPRLPAGKKLRVLDIGTGAGFFAILLGKAGHEVTAIDQSGSMLRHARENVLACGTHATFRKMDAQKLLFPDMQKRQYLFFQILRPVTHRKRYRADSDRHRLQTLPASFPLVQHHCRL